MRVVSGLVWGVVLLFGGTVAHAQDVEREDLRRTLRESLFLDAELGATHRRATYAEDALDGPEDRTELRVSFNGSWAEGTGPLGLYVGAAALAHLPERTPGLEPDPFADPLDRDRLALRRNVRLFGAHAEYVVRDERRRERFAVRVGRLSDLDRSGLVLFDGLSARLAASDALAFRVYGGRRANLDRGLPNVRDDLPVQVIAGLETSLTSGAFRGALSYGFEEVHRPQLELSYEVSEGLELELGLEGIIGPEAAALDPGAAPRAGTAVVVSTAGDWRSAALTSAISWELRAQLGTDPRSFGRNGVLRPEDLASAVGLTIAEGRIDRLFFGDSGPHADLSIDAEQWLGNALALLGGAFVHLPLGDEKDSLNPQVIELWVGPDWALATGTRAGAEVRLAFEDPGDPERIFSRRGDGLRRWGAVRLYTEVGLPLNEALRLAVRPEVEGNLRNTRGPLSETENLSGFAWGAVVTLADASGWRAAARYGAQTLPAFDSEGVELVQAFELWVGGTY